MAFDYVQIIIDGFPLSDMSATGGASNEKLQIRITKDSRRNWLANPRGVFNNAYNYSVNDEVCSGTTFWRVINPSGVAAGGGTPTEGSNWTKSDKWDWAWSDPSKVFILQKIGGMDGTIKGYSGNTLFQLPGKLWRYDAKDEGKLSPDRRTLMLNDGITVSGIDGNGSSVTYDFSTDNYKSFLNWLFYNGDALTTWHFNRILTTPYTWNDPDDFELYWFGDSKNEANVGPDVHNLAGRGPNARQISQRQITVEGGINRFLSLTTEDVLPLVAVPTADSGSAKAPGTDFVDWNGTNGGAVQFIGNYIAGQLSQTTDIHASGYVGPPIWPSNPSVDHDWDGEYGQVIAAVTSNIGLHAMTLDTMFDKLATRAGMLWDSTLCAVPVNTWSDFYTGTGSGGYPYQTITSARKDGGNVFLNTVICYEAIFGSDPRCVLNVSEITTPVSLGWNTPIGDSLTLYAKLFFSKLQFPIDQTTKKASLVFTSLQYLTTVPGTTLNGTQTTSDSGGTLTVTSGSAFLTAATTAIGTDAATYLSGGGTIAAQIQYQGIAQTIIVTGVSGNTVSYSKKDTSLKWPSGAAFNPVKLLNPRWKDGATVQHEQTQVSAKHVELSVKGDDDVVSCPNNHGAPMSITIAHNVRKLGTLGTTYLTVDDIVPNSKVPLTQQRESWTPLNGGPGVPGSLFDGVVSAVSSNGTIGVWEKYFITCPTLDARGLLSANVNANGWTFWTGVVPRGGADVIQYRNPSGTIYYGWVSARISRNVFEISIKTGETAPATGAKILAGYTTGSLASVPNHGWGFDATIGTVFGTPTDYVNTFLTASRIDDTTLDIYGGFWRGMSVVLPNYGVFKIQDLSWDGTHTTVTVDRSIGAGATNVEFRIAPPDINPNGWGFATYLYYMNNSDERFDVHLYQATDSYTTSDWTMWRNQYDTDPNRYSGAYSLSRLAVGLPEPQTDVSNITAPGDAYGAAHYALAQAYAQRFIGVFYSPTRDNQGILATDGTLTGWSNGDSFIEQRGGAVRYFLMEGHEMLEFKQPEISIRSREWPDFSAPRTARRFPVIIKGANGTAGGAGSGGGIGGAGGGSPILFKPVIGTATISTDSDSPVWPVCDILRLTVSANCILTGIVAGTDGQLLEIENQGSHWLQLYNNASATAANNLQHPELPNGRGGNLSLAPFASVTYRYNSIKQAWFLVNFSIR